MIEPTNTLKILIIGDCKVGKTSLLLKYLLKNDDTNFKENITKNVDSTNEANKISNESKLDFLHNYKPTTLSIYKCQVEINLKIHNILFTDPNGNSENDKLAELRKNFYIYENVSKILIK
jgi:GTPase SAR1 family protein